MTVSSKTLKAVVRAVGPLCKANAPLQQFWMWDRPNGEKALWSGALLLTTPNQEVYNAAIEALVNKKVSAQPLPDVEVQGAEARIHKVKQEDGIWEIPEAMPLWWDRVFYAASDDDTRPTMQGVLVERDRMVATDGHRLALAQTTFSALPGGVEKITLTSIVGDVLTAMGKVPGSKGYIFPKPGETTGFNLQIDFGEGTLVYLCGIDAHYAFAAEPSPVGNSRAESPGYAFPDYRQVFPSQDDYRATVKLSEEQVSALVAVLKKPPFPVTVAKTSVGIAAKVLVGEGFALMFSAEGVEPKVYDSPFDSIDLKAKRPPVTGLNRKYLVEALEALSSSKGVTLKFGDGEGPIEVSDSDDNCALIMPMRV